MNPWLSRLCPVVLAFLLQLAPLARWVATDLMTSSGYAVVLRLGTFSGMLLGTAHAVSGASVPSFNGPFEATGTNGVSFGFNIRLSPGVMDRKAESFSAVGLPPGLNVLRVGDNFGRMQGVPTVPGEYVTEVFAWRYSPPDGPTNEFTSEIFVIRILGRPAITTQPATQRRLPGSDATFSVSAAADPAPEYQWRRSGTNLIGETADTLTLTNITTASAGNYTIVVTNSFGSVTSQVATLLIANLPTLSASLAATNLLLKFTGETGVIYQVETSSAVTGTNWLAVTNLAPAFDGPLTLTNAVTTNSASFYQLRLVSQ
jgi:hypothetical protein